MKHIYKTSNAVNFQFDAYLTSPISPIFLHVTNLQRRAGRLFETACLRQTKSSYSFFLFFLSNRSLADKEENLAFHLNGVAESSTTVLDWGYAYAGLRWRNHLCQVAGKSVWSHMVSDVP